MFKLPLSTPGARQTQKSLIDGKKAQNIGMCLFIYCMFATNAHISTVLGASTCIGMWVHIGLLQCSEREI